MITDYETAGKWILGPNRCSCHCHHLTVIFALPHHNDEASEGRMSSGKSQMYIDIYIYLIYMYIYTHIHICIYILSWSEFLPQTQVKTPQLDHPK